MQAFCYLKKGNRNLNEAKDLSFNNDGFDDGLICVNYIVMKKELFRTYYNMLVIYDFHNESMYQVNSGNSRSQFTIHSLDRRSR